ncbi:MAG: GntR family transcriptional regulator [Bacilli bacterium]|jgi:GntR family transcriptional regulator|nr:GntR family transcriptional regulator [Bacilli bacterium]MDD3389333.1 GntR family transcriptional regulator [Bacilli bacterium]MDD4344899.1 GntR family transcriptional regulator [Bacilli bacterium]MDD4521174.1 GntR family transcriptional regulator [Bacilli bacterium]MDY0399544.1 GntR family transcriptional regulator [Bacilli bacterium]
MTKTPIYLELFETYKRYIILGVLKADDRLPSIRELATEKGINPNTVGRAYAQLEEAGYIVSIPQKGFFVLAQEKDKALLMKAAHTAITVIKKSGLNQEKLLQIVYDVYKESN